MKKLLALLVVALSSCAPALAQTPTAAPGSTPTLNPVTVPAGTDVFLDEQLNSLSPTGWTARKLTAAQLQTFVLTGFAPAWSSLVGTPTTLAGYGITDATPLTGVNNSQASISISDASTATTLTRTAPNNQVTINLGAGTGAYMRQAALSTTGAINGDHFDVKLVFAASANPSIQFYNASSSGTALLASPSTTSGLAAFTHTLRFNYDGTQWNLQNDGGVLVKNLGAGVQAATAAALDGTGGLASHASVVAATPASGTGFRQANGGSADTFVAPGAGVVAATQNAVNQAGGHVVADANNLIPYDARAININNQSFIFEGDSISAGYNVATGTTTLTPFGSLFCQLPWALNHGTYYNDASPGATIPSGSSGTNNIVDRYAAGVYPHRPTAKGGSGGAKSWIFLMIGTNDIFYHLGAEPPSSILSSLTAYITQAHTDGFNVVLSTILPRGDTLWTSTLEAARQTVNAGIRAPGGCGADLIVDYDEVLTNPADTTYFQSDLLHITQAGNQAIANYLCGVMTSGDGRIVPDKTYRSNPLTLSPLAPLTLNNPHNQLPGQVGVVPASGDMMAFDQVLNGLLTRYTSLYPLATPGWPSAVAGSGSVQYTGSAVQLADTTTNPSSSMVYTIMPEGTLNLPNGAQRAANFSKAFWVNVGVWAYGSNATPNTVARFVIGKQCLSAPSLGALSSTPGIGFKVVMDTANVAHFYGEVNNGTTLTVSSSSKANLSLQSAGGATWNQVLIYSNGAGTVQFYVNGTLVDTLTGGPTSTGSIGTDSAEMEISNTGDATANNIYFTPPCFYMSN